MPHQITHSFEFKEGISIGDNPSYILYLNGVVSRIYGKNIWTYKSALYDAKEIVRDTKRHHGIHEAKRTVTFINFVNELDLA